MKNKFIVSVIVISMLICSISLGYILNNSLFNKKEIPTKNIDTNLTQEVTNTNENKEEEETNIVLDSKMGIEITDLLKVSNIYSSTYYEKIDNEGLSNDTKRIFSFIKIYMDSKYINFLRSSENYVGNYITAKDLETVAKDLFYKTTSITHGQVFGEGSYDSENKNYTIIPMGFAGSDFKYIIEVPYKINEYSDRIEVLSYKLYVTRIVDMEMEEGALENVFYFDSNRQNNAFTMSDESLYDENLQIAIIKKYIDSSSTDKTKFTKTKYEIKKEDSKYKISKYEKIN